MYKYPRVPTLKNFAISYITIITIDILAYKDWKEIEVRGKERKKEKKKENADSDDLKRRITLVWPIISGMQHHPMNTIELFEGRRVKQM